jgi:hypothetical protein
VRHGQQAEDQGERGLQRLGAEQDLALVDAVGDGAGPGAEEQDRQRLEGDGDAEGAS